MAKLSLADILSGYLSTTAHNTNNGLIETAMENTLSRDGTTPNEMGANLDMNTYEILNLKAPTSATSAARLVDISSTLPDATGTAQLRIDLGAIVAPSGASIVGIEPSGAIAATDVQAALVELDTEKAPLNSPALVTPALGVVASGNISACTGSPALTVTNFTGTSGIDITGNAATATLATNATSVITPLRNHINGIQMSSVGASPPASDAFLDIQAGQCADSTNTYMIDVAAIVKTTGGWVEGDTVGGLDTGTIAANLWYYVYIIKNLTSGVVDACFSLSSSSPSLPTGYTIYRYVGAVRTDGTTWFTPFSQHGRDFMWYVPRLDYSGVGVVAGATLTLDLPKGRNMKAMLNAYSGAGGGTSQYTIISHPSHVYGAPSLSVAPLMSFGFYNGGSQVNGMGSQLECWTNNNAQVTHRSANTTTIYIATLGWRDDANSV